MSNHGIYGLRYDLKKRITSIAATDTNDDEIMQAFCEAASRMFDGTCKREFYPMYEARYFDLPPDDSLLKLDKDLLAVNSFTTQNTGVSLTESTHYYLMNGKSYNESPYDRISMKSDGSYPNLLYSGTVQRSQCVTGWWGYHEDWSNAWQSSGDALAAAISSTTATTFTVADSDGADVYGNTPRFKVGQLLKIDTEYMYLTTNTTGTNTLTVIRGVNGTTAATHAQSTTVYVYRPMREIEQAALRLSHWLYGQKDQGYQNVIAALGEGTVEIPQGAPVDVQMVAARYKRRLYNV